MCKSTILTIDNKKGKIMKCKNCMAEIPDNAEFCIFCGAKVNKNNSDGADSAEKSSSSGKKVISDRHYSLEEIANQQNNSGNENGVGNDKPDDDPSTYLPPIGASDHTEVPMGEIAPEAGEYKLPPITAADPLELLEAGSDPLPPIGAKDHSDVPMGEIIPETGEYKLPPITAEDPLELLEAGTDPLPPIGAKDGTVPNTDTAPSAEPEKSVLLPAKPQELSEEPKQRSGTDSVIYNGVGTAAPSSAQRQLNIPLGKPRSE